MDAKVHTVETHPAETRVRLSCAGMVIADSSAAVRLEETGHNTVYYFPQSDVRMDLLTATDHATVCPFKGDASYWTVNVNGSEIENAAWAYLDPIADAEGIRGHIAFYRGKLEADYEFPD